MATLPKVKCLPGVWTDISGEMTVGISYIIQTNSDSGFFISEKSTSPEPSDSSFAINPKVQQTLLYQSVKFWVSPVSSSTPVTIEIQEAP